MTRPILFQVHFLFQVSQRLPHVQFVIAAEMSVCGGVYVLISVKPSYNIGEPCRWLLLV